MWVDVASGPGGASQWTVDGLNQLNRQWFYYRVGASGPEMPVESINATPTINVFNNGATLSRLDVTWANADYSVRTLFQLVGNTAGTGKANLNETITVANTSADNIVFHLFQYSDFNLAGSAGGQSAQYYQNGIGEYYKVIQSDGFWSVTETATSPAGLGHFEAALSGITLGSLTDANPTTLSDSQTAGVGDVTFAYEWDVTIAPGGSFQISKLIAVVPEPSTVALLVSGLFAWQVLRRGRQA
jgi:hypothetical protein